jgi:hypothetical protein
MKQIKVFRTDATGKIVCVSIKAPEDKSMAFDPSLLQHGILSIGEYGTSGIKVAAFNNWDQALFLDPDGNGYTIEAKNVA